MKFGETQQQAKSVVTGRVIGSVGIARDYRGQARSVQGTNGAVAADHGRCSDHGAALRQILSAIPVSGVLWLDNLTQACHPLHSWLWPDRHAALALM